MYHWLTISALILFGWSLTPRERSLHLVVEICDNALDDDGDGLIDLLDSDCDCPVAEPVSLIPNPSFEDSLCCPTNRGSLHCAETWIQASAATTDYLHSCGWFGWDGLPVPLPIPDGNACIGFRNGRFTEGNGNPNWKEYTGACLTTPLRVGNEYKFQFHIGFTNPENSPSIQVSLYGTADCKNLPFGIDDEEHGCPLNGPGWMLLDYNTAYGSNSWSIKEFSVKPTVDIYAIAIGPDCFEQDYINNPYYFLDNLILADVREFEFTISGKGNACDDSFALSLPSRDSIDYQWYRNGIALVGEKSSSIKPELEGRYQVVLKTPTTCKVTKVYDHVIPQSTVVTSEFLCEGTQRNFYGKVISETGIYRDTLKTVAGCDSIIELHIQKVVDTPRDVQAKIFPGEAYKVGPNSFSDPVMQSVTILSSHGCDSTIMLDLDYFKVFVPNVFSPNGDGLNDYFYFQDIGEIQTVSYLRIFNRWGNMVYEQQDLVPNDEQAFWDGNSNGIQLPEGTYIFQASLLMDDGLEHPISGPVTLIR